MLQYKWASNFDTPSIRFYCRFVRLLSPIFSQCYASFVRKLCTRPRDELLVPRARHSRHPSALPANPAFESRAVPRGSPLAARSSPVVGGRWRLDPTLRRAAWHSALAEGLVGARLGSRAGVVLAAALVSPFRNKLCQAS